MKRLLVVLALGTLCAPASARAATTTYASPDGTGDCSAANPCSLATAVSTSTSEVVVLAGTYNLAATQAISSALDVHGPESGAVPTVVQADSSLPAFTVDDAAAKLRNMRIKGVQIGVSVRRGFLDRLYVSTSGHASEACRPVASGESPTSIAITNSVCWGQGSDAKGIGSVDPNNNFSLSLRNVTAVGGVDGIKLAGTVTVAGTNVIARGGATDVSANFDTYMTFSHSNYDSTSSANGGEITPVGTGTNQMAEPIFVDGALGDFHQTPTSPTVDAGADHALNGPADIDGEARRQGLGTDIGADELSGAPPAAVADSATVAMDAGPTTIDVLANDTDPDGGPKSIASTTQPAHGTVVGSASGLTYQPAAGYCGTDSFTYTLNGGSTATVSITVPCPDPPPAATVVKPAALTGAATAIGRSGARLAGSVVPGGAATTYVFEYGTTTAYGVQTTAQAVGAGTDAVSVSATLTALQAGTTYHYRLLATNSAGTTVGADATFTTLAATAAPRGLTVKPVPRRDRRAPFRFAFKGALTLPAGILAAEGCAGRLLIRISKGKTMTTRRASLSRQCSYKKQVRLPKRFGRRGRLKVTVTFLGNSVLTKKSRTVLVRYG